MSPDKQRIEIAKACGWKICSDNFFKWIVSPDGRKGHCCGIHLSDGEVFENCFQPHIEKLVILPDYLNDLNAMHEAEKVLPKENRYAEWLVSVCKTMNWKKLLSATAAQRAEAFLKTFNLWEES